METKAPTPTSAAKQAMPLKFGIRTFVESHWEKMALWTILIGLFYLLKPFFLLIFETFLITYILKGIVQWIVKRFKLNYRMTTVLVFMLFVSLLGLTGAWVGPKLFVESNNILTDFADTSEQQTRENINRFSDKIVIKTLGEQNALRFIGSEEYTNLREALKTQASQAVATSIPKVLEGLIFVVKIGWKILISLFLAIIFSFILVMDWQKIVKNLQLLRHSRIRTFYLGAAPHLVAFADVLGRAFRAQAIVAVCNTALTAAGLWFFDVPNIALLSTMVFLCGFIPILGTFLSSVPILLFGLQAGGLALVFKLIILITIVHAIEAYGLNPKITANILRIHPILVLILLLLGERFLGLWGMVVGVPIGYYLISVLSQRDDSLCDAESDLLPE